jgi:arylsulfatase A-like enzyme
MLLSLPLLAGCLQPESPVEPLAPEPVRNVVVITIDALRADSVSWAETSFDTTPELAALAADGVVFDQAVTSFPGTTASMPSLMTGLYPSFEGIDDWNRFTYHGFNDFETAEEAERPAISNNLTMLAETLRDHGYRTVGLNTNPNLTHHRNFDQGFTDYDDFGPYMTAARENREHPLEGAYPPVDVVMAKAVPKLEALAAEPFFMWIHLMEPHSPYLPPERFARVSPRSFTDVPDIEINGVLYHYLHRQWGAAPEQISHPSLDEIGITKDELTEHLLGLYEGEIRFCDDSLGTFFAEMERLGILDDTLVIITADHGEEFFDHGYVTHHFESALAEELIRIPLLIRPPGGLAESRRVPQLVRMVDLAPTVLDFAGLAEAAASMDGVSLRPLIEGRELPAKTAFFSTIDYGIARTDRWKYRLEKPATENEPPTELLFDIVADPMETANVAESHPEVLSELRDAWAGFAAHLADRAAQHSAGPSTEALEAEIDPETREQLDALGYLE